MPSDRDYIHPENTSVEGDKLEIEPVEHLPELSLELSTHNFGSTEIEGRSSTTLSDTDHSDAVTRFAKYAVAGRDQKTDFVKAERWRNGRGLFSSWNDKLEAIDAANLPFLHAKAGGKKALQDLVSQYDWIEPKRKPSLKNIAVYCIRLVAKPETISEHKAVSEYASYLIWGAEKRIPPAQFLERARATTLTSCKDFVRALRQREKGRSVLEPALSENCGLVVSRRLQDGKRTTLKIIVTTEQQLRMSTLFEQGAAVTLQQFVDTLRNIA